MARFSGPQHKGALRAHKDKLRTEAEARNAVTMPGRRRRDRPARLTVDAVHAAAKHLAAMVAPGAVHIRPLTPVGEWEHVGYLTGLHFDPTDKDTAPVGAVHTATLTRAYPPHYYAPNGPHGAPVCGTCMAESCPDADATAHTATRALGVALPHLATIGYGAAPSPSDDAARLIAGGAS